MTATRQEVHSFWRMSSAMFLGGFAIFLLLYTTQPLFPIFSKEFNVSPAFASLSLSVTTGTLAIVMLLTAGVSERLGKKQMMSLSLMLSALLTVIAVLSPTFLTLLFFRLLLGVSIAGLPAIAMAYIVEEFPSRNVGLGMGLYLAGNTVGGMTGRIVTGIVADYSSWQIALLLVGGISFLCSVLFIKLLPKPRLEMKDISPPTWKEMFTPLLDHFKNKRLLSLYGLGFLLMGGFVTLYNYMSYHLLEPPYNLSHSFVSWIFLLYLTGTFSSAVMGKVSDWIGKMQVLVIGLVLMLFGAILTLHGDLLIKIVAIGIFTFGFFSCHTVASSWVGVHATHHKAHASSLYLLFYYMGSSIVGTAGGYFWGRFNWIGVITFIGILTISGFLLIAYLSFSFRYSRSNDTQ